MADTTATADYISSELEYFNGLGGFASDGREYVILLHNYQRTPMPWLNVIANAQFGFQVSASGSGYSWAQSSRENQLANLAAQDVRLDDEDRALIAGLPKDRRVVSPEFAPDWNS